mmetsp:Transcript_25824/g.65075  ORF Transcript_25824/g.65075 Transcript_25824/m.65075 type:complete len:233 (-) Transcript_25824:861-1559(-)
MRHPWLVGQSVSPVTIVWCAGAYPEPAVLDVPVKLMVVALVNTALYPPYLGEICVPARLIPLAEGLVPPLLALIELTHVVTKGLKVVIVARLAPLTRISGALVEPAHYVTLDVHVGVSAILCLPTGASFAAFRGRALVDLAQHPVLVDAGGDLDLVVFCLECGVVRCTSAHVSVLALEPLVGVLEHVCVHARLAREANPLAFAVIRSANRLHAAKTQPVRVFALFAPADARV